MFLVRPPKRYSPRSQSATRKEIPQDCGTTRGGTCVGAGGTVRGVSSFTRPPRRPSARTSSFARHPHRGRRRARRVPFVSVGPGPVPWTPTSATTPVELD